MPRTLHTGAQGDDVAAAQRLLNYHLPRPKYRPLEVDGKFGHDTRDRVIEFQRLNRDYPVKMPILLGDGVAKKALEIDGIIGPNTGRVLLDVRVVTLDPASKLTPNQTVSARKVGGPNPVFALTGGGASPSPAPPTPLSPTPLSPPPPSLPQSIRFLTLTAGSQAQLNPWAVQPLVLSGQYTFLARNAGLPDFLLTSGGQFAVSVGSPYGDWSGQIFGQMGLGNINNFGLDLGPLDLVNPFVQLNLSMNKGQPLSAGLAIGNQSTLTIREMTISGIKQPSLFLALNLQEAANVGLTTGKCAAPPIQGMINLGWNFF